MSHKVEWTEHTHYYYYCNFPPISVVVSQPRPRPPQLLPIPHLQLQPCCHPWGHITPHPPQTDTLQPPGGSEASWSNHLGEGLNT